MTLTLQNALPGETTIVRTEELAAKWNEGRNAYPIYAALALQCQLSSLPFAEGQLPPVNRSVDGMAQDLRWLDELDDKIRAVDLRQLLPDTLNTSEVSLRAFVQRQLRKPEKNDQDRDKLDFLLVRYFALCAPESLYHEEIRLSDVARVLQPVLQEEDSTPLEWCEPLDQLLQSAAKCRSLRDLMERGLIETVRIIKETAGGAFYDPAALTAFCRFNFLLRRSFILLLHGDKRAVLDAITQLENLGYKTLDGRRSGFSAAEPLKQIRQYAESWRQPIQKDYSELSVGRDFERLLALRADLEEALEPSVAAAPQQEASASSAPAAESLAPAPELQASVENASTMEVQAETQTAPEAAGEFQLSEAGHLAEPAGELVATEFAAIELPAAPEALALTELLGEPSPEAAAETQGVAEGELQFELGAAAPVPASAEFAAPAEVESTVELAGLSTEAHQEASDTGHIESAAHTESPDHAGQVHAGEHEAHGESGTHEFQLTPPAADEAEALSMPNGIGDQEFSAADLPAPSLGLQSEAPVEVTPILSGLPHDGLFGSSPDASSEPAPEEHAAGHTEAHAEIHAGSDAQHSDSVSAEASNETVAGVAFNESSSLAQSQATVAETASVEQHAESASAPTSEEAGSSIPSATAEGSSASAAEFPAAQAEIEDCIERIWEQLIDAPPTRGRSMSTVMLKNSKVLLSSWEVTAFLSEGGQDSEDLRRAVVARSLLVMGIDQRKHSGESVALESAIAGARKEVSYFQGRVEQSKRDKNVEAAVNLSISTKRLLSSLEEAEALRP
jgi:hypothetical protein